MLLNRCFASPLRVGDAVQVGAMNGALGGVWASSFVEVLIEFPGSDQMELRMDFRLES